MEDKNATLTEELCLKQSLLSHCILSFKHFEMSVKQITEYVGNSGQAERSGRYLKIPFNMG
ncbi:hypothetical protein PsorP6_011905 [Peronosclerospora sorghi]|uniref:Uncharacterized protein n=1 Tax=Peronosclerospora sorghi TaxID=230839 RepID=A0ACC0WKM7_9STRA|nr:hypothetical protein PsorP6_011905 [Peronosclerospora sorghi]